MKHEAYKADFFKTIFIMILSIIISIIFKYINLNEATIILAYILGVLFTSSVTNGYLYGILASIISVLSFNFFFTEPYYTLIAYRADYPVTFLIMLITALITSTLTSREKKEANICRLREKTIEELYKSNIKLLSARNKKQVLDFSGESLVEILKKDIIILMKDDKERYIYSLKNNESKYTFSSKLDENAISYTYEKGVAVGKGTAYHNELNSSYYPIKNDEKVIGVVGVYYDEQSTIESSESMLLQSICAQLALAIQREELYEQNRLVNLEAESERLRGNLLRSISHDLRTPLTSILGSVSTIMDNYDLLETNIKKDLLKNIYDDTVWLSQSFENILSMTRIDEGGLKINKNMEVLDEVVVGAISKVKKYSNDHEIKLFLPDDYLTKPFSISELLARVRVGLRNMNTVNNNFFEEQSVFKLRDLEIDYEKRKVSVRGENIHLTPIEYKIIVLMSKYSGRVLTHKFIIKEIWGSYLENETQSLRVFMASIRRKIEKDPAQPEYVITEMGIGYRLVDE